jgi:uncharacterized protein YqjF (DUF2071 family)
MNLLKRIPIHYKGELHDVRLINFTVDMSEVSGKIPATIKPRNFNGRAMISMVDVKLKNMRPTFLPFMRFSYRHVAFRLLVEDSDYNGGTNKGIFFFRSFTNKLWIAAGGKLLTDYNLGRADIEENGNQVSVVEGGNHVTYCLSESVPSRNEGLAKMIGALDRAYAAFDDGVRMTLIQREKWPIESINCSRFQTTFFKTAKLEGAFRVPETIYYNWLPPKAILA